MVLTPTPVASNGTRPHRRKVGILDLVTKNPRRSLYGRIMNANLASIMPQVLAVWCEEAGHEVRYVCYTGAEDLLSEIPADIEILFIGAFTEAAQLSYALSNLFRQRGAITVLGGPHARCYPEDAQRYFDYVLGFTDRQVLHEVLEECAPSRPLGRALSASRHPAELPSLAPMFEQFARCVYRGRPLTEVPFFVGGQVCVDRAYRGRGLIGRLYDHVRRMAPPEYELCVTEIAVRNQVSLRAHRRLGFEPIASGTH